MTAADGPMVYLPDGSPAQLHLSGESDDLEYIGMVSPGVAGFSNDADGGVSVHFMEVDGESLFDQREALEEITERSDLVAAALRTAVDQYTRTSGMGGPGGVTEDEIRALADLADRVDALEAAEGGSA